MLTELRVAGANCPQCFNATLDALRDCAGVQSVRGSTMSACLAIDHDDGVDLPDLLESVRGLLHGVGQSSAEVVMVSVEPLVVDLHCTHRQE